MKISDIRRHLNKVLSVNTGLKVYHEDINKVTRPCLFIQLINTRKESLSHYREKRNISFDVIYLPSKHDTSCNNEIQDALEDINLAFEDHGNRVLKVLDRFLTLRNVTENITDNMGHFLFDVEFIQQYGKEKECETMLELELEI